MKQFFFFFTSQSSFKRETEEVFNPERMAIKPLKFPSSSKY